MSRLHNDAGFCVYMDLIHVMLDIAFLRRRTETRPISCDPDH